MAKNRKAKSEEIPGQESWRNLSIIRVCDACGNKYHPRKNGYEYLSRFCSRPCTMIGLRRKKRYDCIVPR